MRIVTVHISYTHVTSGPLPVPPTSTAIFISSTQPVTYPSRIRVMTTTTSPGSTPTSIPGFGPGEGDEVGSTPSNSSSPVPPPTSSQMSFPTIVVIIISVVVGGILLVFLVWGVLLAVIVTQLRIHHSKDKVDGSGIFNEIFSLRMFFMSLCMVVRPY